DQVRELARQAKEWPRRRDRDRAYGELLDAVRKDDDRAVLQAADRFLAAPPLAGPDDRATQVQALCDQAREAPNRRPRDAAYCDLLAAQAKEGAEQAVVKAADAFLAVPPGAAEDPRTEQVRRLRQYALEAPNRRVRDAAYQQLVAVAPKGDERGVSEAAQRF